MLVVSRVVTHDPAAARTVAMGDPVRAARAPR
jgi:hypothetical protein